MTAVAEAVAQMSAALAEQSFQRANPEAAALRQRAIREQLVIAKHLGFETMRTEALALGRRLYAEDDEALFAFDIAVMSIANPFGIAALDEVRRAA